MTRWITHEAAGRVLKTVVVWGCDWGRGVKNGGLKGVDQRDEDGLRIEGSYEMYVWNYVRGRPNWPGLKC